MSVEQLMKQAKIARRLAESLEAAAQEMSGEDGVVFENPAPKTAVEGVKRGRGRPKGSKNKPKDDTVAKETKKVEAHARPQNEQNLTDLIISLLEKNKNGLKVSEIVQQALSAGYKTDSKKENGFTQCVYQALHKLSKSEQVSKDGRTFKISA